MMKKSFLPESFNFDVPPVEIIGAGSKGLDKTAMVKRASAFDDVIEKLEKKANRTYLHVITTGAYEAYNSNLNSDAFNGSSYTLEVPYPEDMNKKAFVLDGGLEKYHDATYMKDGAVYQEHQTKSAGVDPSGEIIAARYNKMMKRGELLIAVDTEKWAPRLQKKAKGENIYLSMGCSVPYDRCFPKGTLVLTEYGYRAIERLGVGDIVATNSGTWQPVTATMVRYTNNLTRIHTMGFPIEIECTPNHPFNVVRAIKWLSCQGTTIKGRKRRHTTNGNRVCNVCGKLVDTTAEWISAGDIQVDDYIKIKVDTNADYDTVGESFAYLCGMYIGDGSFTKSITGRHYNKEDGCEYREAVSISASGDPKDADIIANICRCYKAVTGKTAVVRDESRGKNAKTVLLSDRLLTARIFDLCGIGSKTKYISADILGWSSREKAAFLAGYLDSDGCVTPSSRMMRIVSINRGLALATQRLFWSIGVPATTYIGSSEENVRKNSNFGSYSCAYAVSSRKLNNTDLVRMSAKLSRIGCLNELHNGGNTVILDSGYAYVRVNGVRSFECDPVAVYNLEVADDHTYNAEGADVHNCVLCGHIAKVASEHCDHFKHHRNEIYDCGIRSCVMNDAPNFYDISGVNTPADKIAFVLQKVASGDQVKEASFESRFTIATRPPMVLNKAAQLLHKLSRMEKQIEGIIEGDKKPDTDAFKDSDEAKKDFLLGVENFPADEIIDSSSRKGILLTPEMLFKILGKESEDEDSVLKSCDDECCGDMSCMMRELEDDEDANEELLDGSFDGHPPVDLNLDAILDKFVPEFGMTDPALGGKTIRITIIGVAPKKSTVEKKASFNKMAQEALRRTYARYLISFAAQNDDSTCMNALMKIATIGK